MALHDTEPLPTAPYSPDVLADLHADALPHSISNRLWPLVRKDPDAMVVIDALDALSTRLGVIGEDFEHGTPMPPEVVERIDRAIASERLSADVIPLKPRRSTMPRAWIGVAAAVLVLAGVSAFAVPRLIGSPAGESVVAAPLVLDADQVDSQIAFGIIGRRDAGVLSDPVRLAHCLQANGISDGVPVLGSSEVRIDGRTGTLLILPGSTPPALIALAVGNECGVGVSDTLARRDLN